MENLWVNRHLSRSEEEAGPVATLDTLRATLARFAGDAMAETGVAYAKSRLSLIARGISKEKFEEARRESAKALMVHGVDAEGAAKLLSAIDGIVHTMAAQAEREHSSWYVL